jgi:hypothetical protein
MRMTGPKAGPTVKVGIDHERRTLTIQSSDNAGMLVTVDLSVDEVAGFIAILSQCQYALALSRDGQRPKLPIDPNAAFERRAADGPCEALTRCAVETGGTGEVAVLMLSAPQRLTHLRLSPQKARELACELMVAADRARTPRPTTH